MNIRIENYVERTFGDKEIDYTLRPDAINRLSSRLCPFTGEPLSNNKYANVGKWSIEDTSYGVGLGGVTISDKYKIEAWYIRISDSFYNSQKNKQRKLKRLNILLLFIAVVSAAILIYAIIYAKKSNISNAWIIAIPAFLGSIGALMVSRQVGIKRVAKISKQVVQRTGNFPIHGIPPIDHNKLDVLVETNNIKEYIETKRPQNIYPRL